MSKEKGIEKNNKKKLMKKISIVVGLIIVSLIMLLGGGYLYVRNKIYSNDTIPKNKIDFKEVSGITNILLIGTDARNLDEPARSDSIMILTIDNNNKKLKLTSIMRDTFVDIPGYGQGKINAALSYGDVPLLIETIKENFGIGLDKYLMVNFWGFESIIDILGGIDVDVKDYELEQLNKYIGEQHKSSEKSPKITEAGMQKLDGQQALSYARIRKTGNGDYERTDRQRRVLGIIAEKFKDVNPMKYPSFMYEMLPHIKTNIEPFALLNYAYTASKFPSLEFEQLRLPIEELTADVLSYKNYGAVLLIDKEQHKKIIDEYIFNDIKPNEESYSVSEWRERLNKEYYGYDTTTQTNSGVTTKPPVIEERPKSEKTKPTNNNSNNTGNNSNNSTNTGNSNNSSGSNNSNNSNNSSGANSSNNSNKPNIDKPSTGSGNNNNTNEGNIGGSSGTGGSTENGNNTNEGSTGESGTDDNKQNGGQTEKPSNGEEVSPSVKKEAS